MKDTTNGQLRPCPFCGSTDLSFDPDGDMIVCDDCGCFGPSPSEELLSDKDSTDEQVEAAAAEIWNKRAKVPEPPEIYCELCPKESPSPAVYEAWLRKRDPFLGTKTGHLIKIYICEACNVNDKKEETANEVPAPTGNRS